MCIALVVLALHFIMSVTSSLSWVLVLFLVLGLALTLALVLVIVLVFVPTLALDSAFYDSNFGSGCIIGSGFVSDSGIGPGFGSCFEASLHVYIIYCTLL